MIRPVRRVRVSRSVAHALWSALAAVLGAALRSDRLTASSDPACRRQRRVARGAARARRPRSTTRRSCSRPRRGSSRHGRGRSRGSASADRRRLPAGPRRGRHRADARARDARRRGVRPGLGGVARPGPAARRTGDPRGAAAQGRRPARRRRSSSRSGGRPFGRGMPRPTPRRTPTQRRRQPIGSPPERLIAAARPSRARRRRIRGSGASGPTRSLARNGFDPETCREVAAMRRRSARGSSPSRRLLGTDAQADAARRQAPRHAASVVPTVDSGPTSATRGRPRRGRRPPGWRRRWCAARAGR